MMCMRDIDVSDLRKISSDTKDAGAQTVKCDKALRAQIDAFRDKHGARKTAEVIRRLIKMGLPQADEKLSAG